MKEEILDIAKKLYHNHLTPETATNLLLDLLAVSRRSEQLIDFAIKNGYIDDMPKGQKDGLIDKFEKSINCY